MNAAKRPHASLRSFVRALALGSCVGAALAFVDGCTSAAPAVELTALEEAGTPERGADGAVSPDGATDTDDDASSVEPDASTTVTDAAPAADADAAISTDAALGDAAVSSDGAPADSGSDADTSAPWRLVLGQQFNVNDVLATPTGEVYVVGSRIVGGLMRGLVLRISANGQLDTTYGSGGYAEVVASPTKANQPLRGVLLPNGKLVLVGLVYSTPWDFVLTRLDTNGAIDTTFGASGFRQVHVGVGNDLPRAITLGANGTVLFTGLAFGATNFANEVVVGRVDANGALDPTFDGDGLAITSVGGQNAGMGIGLVSQDRILVAAQSNKVSDLLLLRFTSNGALDGTFSTGENAGTTLPAGTGVLRFPSATLTSPEGMQKDSSGNWVIYGKGEVPAVDAGAGATRSALFAVRVDENGAKDATFHGGGGPFALTPTGASQAYSFASLPNGNAVVAGTVYEGPVAPIDSTKLWPGFVALDPNGDVDMNAWGVFKGIYVPHAYAGSSAIVATLPNGRVVTVVSTDTSVEVFVLAP